MDRAQIESNAALDLRTRDRERKLLQKIEAALRRAPPTAAVHRAPPSPVHPVLRSVRLLVAEPTVLRLCRAMLLLALYNPHAVADVSRCVDRVLHLLELGAQAVHESAGPSEETALEGGREATFWSLMLWTPAGADSSASDESVECDEGRGVSMLAALHAPPPEAPSAQPLALPSLQRTLPHAPYEVRRAPLAFSPSPPLLAFWSLRLALLPPSWPPPSLWSPAERAGHEWTIAS